MKTKKVEQIKLANYDYEAINKAAKAVIRMAEKSQKQVQKGKGG